MEANCPTITSIMLTSKNKKFIKKITLGLLVFLFWVSLWWIAALLVNDNYFLPSPKDTVLALFGLLGKKSFYKVVFSSFLRVLAGLVSGTVVGTALAFLCHKFKAVRSLVSPIISVIKAMPVATFILLVLYTIRGYYLIIFIGFIMVMPIIYQNVLSGLDAVDKNLMEICRVYGFNFVKKLRLLTFPSIKSYLFPAIITSVGLAFKSQIAAEIIAYTKDSIGQYIYDANYTGTNTDVVLAWAVVIVSFSIGLEAVCKYILGRIK